MEMARREDMFDQHAAARVRKDSTGYPDSGEGPAVSSAMHTIRGVGFRWGMGASTRSGGAFCATTAVSRCLDDMSNWVADKPIAPKYLLVDL